MASDETRSREKQMRFEDWAAKPISPAGRSKVGSAAPMVALTMLVLVLALLLPVPALGVMAAMAGGPGAGVTPA